MQIRNIEGLSPLELKEESEKGGRFVYYEYAVSFLLVTFKRTSDTYLIRAGENVSAKGWAYTLVTALLGWWGFPKGPKYTFQALRTNLRGGNDVTEEIMSTVEGFLLFEEVQNRKKAS